VPPDKKCVKKKGKRGRKTGKLLLSPPQKKRVPFPEEKKIRKWGFVGEEKKKGG